MIACLAWLGGEGLGAGRAPVSQGRPGMGDGEGAATLLDMATSSRSAQLKRTAPSSRAAGPRKRKRQLKQREAQGWLLDLPRPLAFNPASAQAGPTAGVTATPLLQPRKAVE